MRSGPRPGADVRDIADVDQTRRERLIEATLQAVAEGSVNRLIKSVDAAKAL